jgi:hypothetical protein
MAVQPRVISDEAIRGFAHFVARGEARDRQILEIRDAMDRGDRPRAIELLQELGHGERDLPIFCAHNEIPGQNDDQRYLNQQFRRAQAEKLDRLQEDQTGSLVDPTTGEIFTKKQEVDAWKFTYDEGWEIRREGFAREDQQRWDALHPMEKAAYGVWKIVKMPFDGLSKVEKWTRPLQDKFLDPILHRLPTEGPRLYALSAAVALTVAAGTASFFSLRPYR